ncbi:hypothetical protein PVNG_04746 [Plasmodium vivax North Korean]|uniref:Variable surface protein n=1 Tax=Plasmodium vivax North Korean TaxID=1035514 RepID=A0A0J9U115_PLAVI|nr:hypothetical protein PVNG_04746 [Plasmodium vivax North Korean]
MFEKSSSKPDAEYEKYCQQLDWKDSSSRTNFHNECKDSMKYLSYLEGTFRSSNEKVALGMVFLYCWLFDNVLSKFSYDGKKLDIYKNMLKQLLEIEYSNLEYIFQEYIQEDIIEVLQILYDLYDKFLLNLKIMRIVEVLIAIALNIALIYIERILRTAQKNLMLVSVTNYIILEIILINTFPLKFLVQERIYTYHQTKV